jgi:heme/copper-type cytochrome/quinol oxidase subunit 2
VLASSDAAWTPEKSLGAGGETAVPKLGVHFLAYWVGVIAFAVLFIIYGLAFFLFKYNESSHTTDHKDRAK